MAVSGGGLQSSPAAAGDVYSFNTNALTKVESDIQMDVGIGFSQHARRYLKVSGIAIPDDSGFTDRFYHSLTFGIRSIPTASSTNYYYLTLPVDTDNRFEGYLYFLHTGTNTVFAYRAMNDFLYPDPDGGSHMWNKVYFDSRWWRLGSPITEPPMRSGVQRRLR